MKDGPKKKLRSRWKKGNDRFPELADKEAIRRSYERTGWWHGARVYPVKKPV